VRAGFGLSALGFGLIAHAAAAEPRWEIDHEPASGLHMRPAARTAVAVTAPATVPAPAPAPPPSPVPQPPAPDAAYVRDVREPVQVRFSLGYQVDGTTQTGDAGLGGKVPNTTHSDYDLVHAYGFGEGYLATHGVGLPSLSTYFGAHFELSQHDISGNAATPPPIATWFDRSGVTYQNVWGELKDFLSPGLAPLRVRAGEQYIYGPWVAHMYGALAAWDGKLVSGEVYAGSRVPDYTLDATSQELDRAGIAGGSARIDLRELSMPIPFSFTAQGLTFTRLGATASTLPASFTLLEVDWRPRDDLTLIGQWRTIDGTAAEEHVQLRVRYHQVTNVVVDVTHREETDWRWDPSLTGSEQNDPLAAKRYLDLGPVQPQVLVSARAGTLIAENVDLYARAAWSQDLVSAADDVNTFYATYYEGGGALEVRVRRTLSVGLSGLARYTDRADQMQNRVEDTPNVPDPLPISAAMGERDFVEAGATARMSLGSRKFSALVEIYGRDTDYALDYCIGTRCQSDSDTGVPTDELRGGGRFQVDAWIGKRVRLFASYDLSTRLPFAPDITGYKSLKLIMEGVY
jgi:hypothetical protein